MRVSAAGQPLGETRDQLPGDQSFSVSEQPSLLWMAQGTTARIKKGVPHHCSSELTLSRSCYRQHEDFSYAPSSSFYFLLLLHLLSMGVSSHQPLPPLLAVPSRRPSPSRRALNLALGRQPRTLVRWKLVEERAMERL
jgi:hypothetical protein